MKCLECVKVFSYFSVYRCFSQAAMIMCHYLTEVSQVLLLHIDIFSYKLKLIGQLLDGTLNKRFKFGLFSKSWNVSVFSYFSVCPCFWQVATIICHYLIEVFQVLLLHMHIFSYKLIGQLLDSTLNKWFKIWSF